MKPYPIICLPTWEQQEILFRQLRSLGWCYLTHYDTDDEDWEKWKDVSNAADACCMCIVSMNKMSAYRLNNRPWTHGESIIGQRYTRMNSIRHFVEYAKKLRAEQASVLQRVTPDRLIMTLGGVSGTVTTAVEL